MGGIQQILTYYGVLIEKTLKIAIGIIKFRYRMREKSSPKMSHILSSQSTIETGEDENFLQIKVQN